METTWRDRLRYRIDEFFGRGTIALIVGLFAVSLLIVLVIGIEALRLYLGRRGDWTAPAAAVGAIAVAALHSTVDFSLEMEANALFFLAILAIPAGEGHRAALSAVTPR